MQSSTEKPRILWMIPKWTLPVSCGARFATDALVRNTIRSGAQVDVLCLPQKSEKIDIKLMKDSWGVEDIFVYPRSLPQTSIGKKLFYLKRMLLKPLTPLTMSSFADSDIRSFVKNCLSLKKYDFIVLDGLHLAATILDGGNFDVPSGTQVIYRAHNVELDLWKRSYQIQKNPLLKFVLYFQSLLVEKFEKSVIMESDGIAAISQEDMDEIKKISATTKIELIPLGLKFDSPVEMIKQSEIKFLFVGTLDWPPNKDGLEWLLKEVWPQLIQKRPEATLSIVGGGNRSWLAPYKDLKGVKILGFVDSIRDAYRDCHFTIVPVFYGSGTRIKVLEAFALGRRLISSKMGVQGADLTQDDYINAETREEWIKVLSTVQLDEAQVAQLQKSREVVAGKFDEKNIGLRFYNWLKALS